MRKPVAHNPWFWEVLNVWSWKGLTTPWILSSGSKEMNGLFYGHDFVLRDI